VGADTVEFTPRGDTVSVETAATPLLVALRSIAEPRGYGLVAAGSVSEDKVSVRLRGVPFELAVRELAAAAGMAAVFDHRRHAIYVAREATYTYRLPVHLFETTAMDYMVSSSGTTAPSTSGAAAPGANGYGLNTSGLPTPGQGTAGVGTSTSGLPASTSGPAGANGMRVQGRSNGAANSILAALREMAGRGAQVNLIAETGIVSVRADGTALKRISGFIQTLMGDAARQVELKAALIEVTLSDELAWGIDWARLLNGNGQAVQLGLATAASVTNPAFSAQVTSASIKSVIQALEGRTTVKVVAEPQLWMLNHQPGIVFNATQRPYLGSVSTAISGAGGLATSAGALSFVMDGVSLAFKPNILDHQHAEMTVIPVLSTAVNQQTFSPGPSTTLVGYDLPTTSSHLKVLLESGKTYIIGGNRFSTQSVARNGLPGTLEGPASSILSGHDDKRSSRELVLLLHAMIAPAPSLNPLIGEAL
jgi:type II secretory pathway component GspD/PulD (secretin)